MKLFNDKGGGLGMVQRVYMELIMDGGHSPVLWELRDFSPWAFHRQLWQRFLCGQVDGTPNVFSRHRWAAAHKLGLLP